MSADEVLSEVYTTLDHYIDTARDLTPIWDEVGRVWAVRQSEVFASRGYERWAPLKANTILRKRREGEPTAILVSTGALKNQVTRPTPRNEGPHFAVYGPQTGADIAYAKYHLHGNGVPQRNPVPKFRPHEFKKFIEVIRRYMSETRPN
jgi:hypothetical protein